MSREPHLARLTAARWLGLGYGAAALVLCSVLGFTTDPVSTRLAPTVPAVPAPLGTHLDGLPEAGGAQVADVRKSAATLMPCHQWPDGQLTQTSDPLSPACIPTWDWAAGNGGSTSRGVESNVVRIGVPQVGPVHDELTQYFNANYQFYGRSLEFVSVGPMSTAEQLQAASVSAASQGVFAVLGDDITGLGGSAIDADQFITAMARKRVIAVASGPTLRQSTLDQSGVFGWAFQPSEERQAAERARFICASLQGHPAAIAPDFAARTRKFAIVTAAGDPEASWLAQHLAARLTECRLDVPVVSYPAGGFDPAKKAQGRGFLKQLIDDAITSLIVIDRQTGSVGTSVQLDAEALDYAPEWVLHNYSTPAQQPFEGTYIGSAKGVRNVITTYVGRAQTFAGQVAPDVAAFSFTGRVDPYEIDGADRLYNSLSMLAAGIQNAGPTLTPESFAGGLEAGRYPNPGADGPPLYQPGIGIQDGRHSFVSGMALMRYVPDIFGPGMDPQLNARPGLLCFASGGKRYEESDEFPADDGVFRPSTGPCPIAGNPHYPSTPS